MTYTHFEHRHNFASWCAARALQSNRFGDTYYLADALEKTGINEFIKHHEDKPISQEEFDKMHSDWCDSLVQTWKDRNFQEMTYGFAAKLIAVYLKAMIIIKNPESELSFVVHPLITRNMLQNISKDKTIKHPNRMYWKAVNWTELDKEQYLNLIHDLRIVFKDEPFWHFEKYRKLIKD